MNADDEADEDGETEDAVENFSRPSSRKRPAEGGFPLGVSSASAKNAPPPTAEGGTTAPVGMACALCGGRDDDGVCERLMFCEPGCWVHLNCAYWSSEVRVCAGVPVPVPARKHCARFH